MSNYGTNILQICPYGTCAFQNKAGRCTILTDVSFSDGVCHFRKEKKETPNLYDAGKDKSQSAVRNRRELVKKLWESGLTKEEIAERCHVTPETIKRHLELLGLQR